MESLQKQILALSHKLDALYQVIEGLDRKVSDTLSGSSTTASQLKDRSLADSDYGRYQFKERLSFSSEMEHKDVISDGFYMDTSSQGGERHLTPEIQIQRLTAQLTAAYNRIAALEEQLLKERIH